MKTILDNTFIVLIGFAGSGKYTIGRELSKRVGANLIDNHLINNPIFKVVNADGITPLPAAVWERVKEIRRIVYETILDLGPPNLSFIFTHELRESNPFDHRAILDLEELAAARNSLFIPIRLVCDVEELCRRVADPKRIEQLKESSTERAREKFCEDAVLTPIHENLRTIDVTMRSPIESVDAIIQEIELIRGVEL